MSDKQKSVSQEIADSYRQVRVMTWQSIETAPFDESVFVYCRIHDRFIAYKERIGGTDFGQWCKWDGEKGILPPTHWMPLPPPPESE